MDRKAVLLAAIADNRHPGAGVGIDVPTRFELVLNGKAAQAIGLALPGRCW